MTNLINIEITRDNLIGILNEYYTNKLGHKVTVSEKHYIGSTGFGMYESTDAVVSMSYTEEVNINGFKATKTINIDLEDIKEILKESLCDYEITNLILDKGITSVGFYETREAYFKGVKLTLKEKSTKLTLRL